MPSARYYRRQAKLLLSWAKATQDKSYADRLRTQAATELENAQKAQKAHEAVADLNPLLAELNARQLRKWR